MHVLYKLLLFLILPVVIDCKIYNILGCNVRDDVILECDGSKTPITKEHERILDTYMADLAAYYRQQYPTNNAPNDESAIIQPQYPRLCKTCD